VIGRLKESGDDAAYFEKWLADAEKTRRPELLIRWPTTIFWYISGKSSATTNWLSRYIALLDTGRFADGDAGRAGHLRRHFADRLARLGNRPLVQPDTKITEGPWADYIVTELKFEQPVDFDQWIGIHVDQDRLQHGNKDALVIAWRQQNGEACVGRARVEGGPIRQIGRSFPFQFGSELKLAASSEAIFVASATPGLAMVTNNEVQVFSQKDGAPADQVLAMAWLGDALYVSFDSALAKFDPEVEKFTLLASAHSVQPRGSLDAGGRYYVRTILSDEERGCLWLDIYSGNISGRSGIWTFVPATGKLEKVISLPSAHHRSAIKWSDGDVFFHAGRNWYVIDPRTRKDRVLNQFAPFQPTYKGTIQAHGFIKIGAHVIGANGQIYENGGREYRRPMDFAWKVVGRLGDGALVANFATSVNKIWHIKPSAKKTAVTVDDKEEQNVSKPQAGDRLEKEQ
jgi:hypothetical protein